MDSCCVPSLPILSGCPQRLVLVRTQDCCRSSLQGRIGAVQPPISLTIIGRGLSSGDVQRAAELRALILSAGAAICICPNQNGQTRTTKAPQTASPLPPRAQSVGRRVGCPGFCLTSLPSPAASPTPNVEHFPKRPANLAGHLFALNLVLSTDRKKKKKERKRHCS